MVNPARKSTDSLDTTTLVAGALGVTPIPILGEIGLSYFFCKMLASTPYKLAGIPVALLTRFILYGEFYAPLYERIIN